MSEDQAVHYENIGRAALNVSSGLLSTAESLSALVVDDLSDEDEDTVLWIGRALEYAIKSLNDSAGAWQEMAIRERQMDRGAP
jgi:aromatic ring-cleaving dioxygenase